MIDIKERLREEAHFSVAYATRTLLSEAADHIATLEKESAANLQRALVAEKDAERLNKLDSIGIAYGFQDMHEGNTWTIGGAYSSVRDALDGFRMADTSTQKVK